MKKLSLILALCLFAHTASAHEIMPCDSKELHDMVLKKITGHISQLGISGEAVQSIYAIAKNGLNTLRKSNTPGDQAKIRIMENAGGSKILVCKSTAVPNFYVFEMYVENYMSIDSGNYGIPNDEVEIKLY